MNNITHPRRTAGIIAFAVFLLSQFVAAPSRADDVATQLSACPIVIAHRGGTAGLTVEDSTLNWTTSLASGVDVIEVDIHFTSDNVPIVMHDDTLDRTTTGHGKISHHTFAQISKLTLANGDPIPLFSKVLRDAHSAGAFVMFEPKKRPSVIQWGIIEKIVDAELMANSVIVESFSRVTIAAATQRGFFTTHVYHKTSVDTWALANADSQLNKWSYTSSTSVVDAHAASYFAYETNIASADEPLIWASLMTSGVQAIVTDNPIGLLAWESGKCVPQESSAVMARLLPDVNGMGVQQAQVALHTVGFSHYIIKDDDSWLAKIADDLTGKAHDLGQVINFPTNTRQSVLDPVVLNVAG